MKLNDQFSTMTKLKNASKIITRLIDAAEESNDIKLVADLLIPNMLIK